MPTRRSMLSSIVGVAGVVALPGCSSVTGGTTERHYVDVLNGSHDRHRFEVTVDDESGETIFEHGYDLAGREGDENRIVEGTPSSVTVVVDGDETTEFPWAPREGPGFPTNHPDGCSDATSTSLTIRYAEDDVHATYGCETVRGQPRPSPVTSCPSPERRRTVLDPAPGTRSCNH